MRWSNDRSQRHGVQHPVQPARLCALLSADDALAAGCARGTCTVLPRAACQRRTCKSTAGLRAASASVAASFEEPFRASGASEQIHARSGSWPRCCSAAGCRCGDFSSNSKLERICFYLISKVFLTSRKPGTNPGTMPHITGLCLLDLRSSYSPFQC